MKKAKQVLSLVMAAIMVFAIAVPTAFAKTAANNYEVANIYPYDYTDGVQKYKFTAEEGAGYVLDLLDGLLYDAALDLTKEPVTNVAIIGDVYLKADLTSIDTALYFVYNIVKAVNGAGKDYLDRVLKTNISNTLVNLLIGVLNLGDIKNLNVDDLGNQNSNGSDRICRNVNYSSEKPTKSDMEVLMGLIKFLNTNADILAKIADGSINFGLLDGTIKDIDNVGKFLSDLPGALRELLYSKLINTDYEEGGSVPTLDADVQNIINWFLISGTGTDAASGGKSILGENKEGFLPAMGNYPGGASIGNEYIDVDRDGDGVKEHVRMNFYQLVNNALNALLSGFVADKLEGLLFDLLDIDPSVNDGKGDTAIMQDMIFTAITGAIEGLCVANGAPAIVYTQEEETYPIPKIRKLLDWFFNGGGLATFVKISYSGIQITDNFMSLLNDVARMLPGLFPLFGFEVPDGLTYTNEEMNETWVSKYGEDIYLTYQGEEIDKHFNETTGVTTYTYRNNYPVGNAGTLVNTTDNGQSNFRNPDFIRPKYVLSNQNIYAALVKILLNHFIDGCYFPEWADTIPSVGAYALASLAAQYIPENNYFDRLDAYHEGAGYTPRVGQSVTPLPYTEEITLKSGDTVTIPRAVMDIGASLGAFFLSGWQDFEQGLGYKLETDTCFELFALEFLTWACATYMPIFSGKWDSPSQSFTNLTGNIKGTWQDTFNTAMSVLRTSRNNHPVTGTAINRINNIPAGEIRNALYDLIDGTLFVLIPHTWLPDWVARNKSAGLVNEWLGQSLCTLDLQKIISLLGVNSTGELNESVTVVLIRLVDRVLGTVFGGHPLLPNVDRTSVFSANTTITTLDGILGNTSNTPLKNLLIKLLGYLNTYGRTLCGVIFPLILSGEVKSHAYYASTSSSQMIDYLGNGTQIELETLQNYIDANNSDGDDLNATAFSGPVYFTSDAKAADVASKIGVSFNADTDYEVIDGSTKYKVIFPATYARMSYAETAASYVDNSYAKRITENGNRIYKLYVKDNYRLGTSTETVSTVSQNAQGVITEREYHYNNIHSIEAIKGSSGYQTGSKGEVVFPNGYRTSGREDFRAFEVYYTNRYFNAVEDAQEFIDSFNTYAHSTLPDAYGTWIMYFVKMQLRKAGLTDGNVGVPDKDVPYPFYAASGNSYESYIGPETTTITDIRNQWKTGTSGRQYPFAYGNTYNVVEEALAYADALEEDGTNHDVTFGVGDTEAIVRLALNSNTFTITGKTDAEIAAAWASISASDRNKITTLCNGLGITFDSDNNKITRKSFKLIGTKINNITTFGNWYDDDNNATAISIQPAQTYTPGAEDAAGVTNDIQKCYITFAKTAKEFDTHLNDYYDNLSWRMANREAALEGNTTDTTTLEWVLDFTKEAYKNSEGKRNMKKNAFGTWVTAYTAKSYDEFQKAYEYGAALKAELLNTTHNHILQSLITQAYKAILKAYYNLHDFDAKPDWTTLENLREMARAIINGPLGIGNDVDRDVGYTLPTLNNLVSALAHADDFYNNNQGQDIEFQDTIDEETTILQAVISALEFPEGIVPGAIKDPSPSNTSDLEILDSIGQTDCSYTMPGDSRTYKIILGMTEGVNFTDDNGTMPSYEVDGVAHDTFVSSGYTVNGSSNDFISVKGTYGGGTGSYLVGRVNYAEAFKYYAVLIGDVNGDARIDSADKTIISMIIANGSENEIEKFRAVAADVNGNGVIDAQDAEIISDKVNHDPAFAGISQTAGSGTAAWFPAPVEG